jgi:hypothetical protein
VLGTIIMYPFAPKSTATLQPGQFWAVPLAEGMYGCGRVLQVKVPNLPSPTRAFFGGLHQWLGSSPPTGADIAQCPLVHFGVMHIKAITENGGVLLGHRSLEADNIELPLLLSAQGGPDAQILRGAIPIRAATPEEWGTLPVLGYWGYDFIQSLASRLHTHGA